MTAGALPASLGYTSGLSGIQRASFGLYGLSMFLVPVARLGTIDALGPAIQLSDLVFAAAGLVWLLGVRRGEFRLLPRGSLAPLALYAGACAISAFVAPQAKAAIVHLLGLAFLVALFAMTASLASTPQGFRVVIASWLCGAFATGLFGVLSALLFYLGLKDRSLNIFLWNYGSIPVGAYPRIAGLFPNANMLCNYLAVSLAACVAAWPASDERERRILLIGGASVLITSVFTLSAGFGGIVGAAAGGWIYWQWRQGSVRVWRELAVGSVGAVALLSFVVLSVFLLVPAGEGDVRLGPADLQLQSSGRVATWTGAWSAFVERPLFGQGLGTGVLISHPRALHPMEHWGTQNMRVNTPRVMEAHNVVLSVLSQLGIVGFAGFMAFLASLAAQLKAWGSAQAADTLVRVALFCGLFAAVLYHGLFGAFEESRQYWWLFGIIAALQWQPQQAGS